MLHEVLLVLAGHTSPIVSDTPTALSDTLLHPSETALIANIAQFGRLHYSVKTKVAIVLGSYMDLPSPEVARFAARFYPGPYSAACHAVANLVEQKVTGEFNRVLIQLERSILSSDKSLANTSLKASSAAMSLTSIVAQTVHLWLRRFQYADELLGYIMSRRVFCHEILTRLANDSDTGFPDVKCLVMACITAVENVWVSLIVSWIFYGKAGTRDFFIDVMINRDGIEIYRLNTSRIPLAVSQATAQKILTTGESIAHFMRDSSIATPHARNYDTHGILMAALKDSSSFMNGVEHPIRDDQLSFMVSQVQNAVYTNIAANMLPIPDIERFLHVIRSIVLAGSVYFVEPFLDEVSKYSLKQSSYSRTLDLSTIIAKSISAFGEDGSQLDRDVQDMALSILQGSSSTSSSSASSILDMLRSHMWPDRQHLELRVRWPLDIIITHNQQCLYSDIFTLLVVMRMETDKVTDLWRIRRLLGNFSVLDSGDDRINRQRMKLISLWLLASQLKFFFDYLWKYMQSLVIDPAVETMRTVMLQQKRANKVNPQELASVHAKMVTTIYQGLFLDKPEVLETLHSLCLYCSKLVYILDGRAAAEKPDMNVYESELPILQFIAKFQSQLESQSQISPEINQLLVSLATICGDEITVPSM